MCRAGIVTRRHWIAIPLVSHWASTDTTSVPRVETQRCQVHLKNKLANKQMQSVNSSNSENVDWIVYINVSLQGWVGVVDRRNDKYKIHSRAICEGGGGYFYIGCEHCGGRE